MSLPGTQTRFPAPRTSPGPCPQSTWKPAFANWPATPMTAGQLERFAQAHRRVTREHEGQIRSRRRLSWHWVDDFEFTFRGLLPPEEAAVVLQALRAAMNDLEHPHDEHDHDRDETASAEARAQRMRERDSEDGIRWDEAMPPPPRKCDAGSLAGALVEICAEYLASRAAHADNPDTYQVIIHVGAGAITTPAEGQTTQEPAQ